MAKKRKRKRKAHPAGNGSTVVSRMRAVARGHSMRGVAILTGLNPETVRRYFATGRPSVEFVRAFCVTFGASADWVLGVGQEGGRAGRHVWPVRNHLAVARRALAQCEKSLHAAEACYV